MRISLASFFLSSLAWTATTHAVLYGDEGYAALEGYFWAFYANGTAVINPENCSIVTTIDADHNGNPLPEAWADGIYMQYHNRSTSDSRTRKLHEGEDHSIKGYIMINSGVTVEDDDENSVSHVYAFDTLSMSVVSIVKVGPRVVHSYGVHNRDEFWTHSDEDGHFYVIDLADLTKSSDMVKAHVEKGSHGKLLWDEDGTLGNRGYATAINETFLFQLDLVNGELTRSYDFSKDVLSDTCGGLHSIGYSRINQHVYAECVGGPHILEFDVNDPDEIVFVQQHIGVSGAIYEVPDGSYVVASDKGAHKLHVFQPKSNGVESTIAHSVTIQGHPGSPSFYPLDNVDGGADFTACFPLTSNPNKDQADSDGNVQCDYYQCSNATTAEDVQHGVCLYSVVDGVTPNLLKRVTSATNETNCLACSDSTNFVDGSCTCTPECGFCDTDIQVDLDSFPGIACIDLAAVVKGQKPNAKYLYNAGAVKQSMPYPESDECSFGRTYRQSKRGTKYDASVANYPSNSIVIVDMSTQTVKCQVNLTGAPSRVVYAPIKPTPVEGVGPQVLDEDAVAGGTSGVMVNVAASFVLFGGALVAMMA